MHIYSRNNIKIFRSGKILINNHSEKMGTLVRQLVKELRDQKMVKWKQMKCVELAGAVLAEILLVRGVVFDLEQQTTEWPSGHKVKPPKKLTKSGKNSSKSEKSCDAPGVLFNTLTKSILEEEKEEGLKQIGKHLKW